MISASPFYLFLVAMRRAWPPFVVCSVPVRERKSHPMLYWAIVFAVLALAAGILGFVGLSGTLALIAKILWGHPRSSSNFPLVLVSSVIPGVVD
jgi:hypothetical protein